MLKDLDYFDPCIRSLFKLLFLHWKLSKVTFKGFKYEWRERYRAWEDIATIGCIDKNKRIAWAVGSLRAKTWQMGFILAEMKKNTIFEKE